MIDPVQIEKLTAQHLGAFRVRLEDMREEIESLRHRRDEESRTRLLAINEALLAARVSMCGETHDRIEAWFREEMTKGDE